MQVAADDLTARLEQRGLESIYFFHGEEPLQLLECSDAVRARARAEGVGERVVFDAETGIDWDAVLGMSSALSLFSARRLVEVRLGTRKPDKAGTAVLETLAARGDGEDVLLVTAGKLDQRMRKASWCKALEKSACCIVSRELRQGALPGWLARRARRHGKRLTTSAGEIVADRVEGNMLAAAQEVEKLCLLVEGTEIAEADVLGAVRDSARFDVFQLVDAVLAGDLLRAIRVVRGLREEGLEPVLVNWALGRELRQLAAMAGARAKGASDQAIMDKHRVWSSRRTIVQRALNRFRADELLTLLAYANFIDTVIKGARPGEPWDAVELLIVNASGASAYRSMLEMR